MTNRESNACKYILSKSNIHYGFPPKSYEKKFNEIVFEIQNVSKYWEMGDKQVLLIRTS